MVKSKNTDIKSRLTVKKPLKITIDSQLPVIRTQMSKNLGTNDARLKILEKNSSTIDARQHIIKKQQLRNKFNKDTREQRLLKMIKNDLLDAANSNDNDTDQNRLISNRNNKSFKVEISNNKQTNLTKTIINNHLAKKPLIIRKSLTNLNNHNDDDDEIDDVEIKNENLENIKIHVNCLNKNENFADKNQLRTRINALKENSNKTKVVLLNDDQMEVDYNENSFKTKTDIYDESTITGFRLIISNINDDVTEDDIMELFSEIGPIKRARFMKKGVADVVYVHLKDARDAINKYNNRELDGKPLKIELATRIPISEKINIQNLKQQQMNTIVNDLKSSANNKPPSENLIQPAKQTFVQLPQRTSNIRLNNKILTTNEMETKPGDNNLVSKHFLSQNSNGNKVVSSKQIANNSQSKVEVNTAIIHQALFSNSSKPQINTNPVTFTVKI